MRSLKRIFAFIFVVLSHYSFARGASLASLTIRTSPKAAILIDDKNQKTGFETNPEQFFRQIPNSDWRETPPLTANDPVGSDIEVANPVAGSYTLELNSTNSSPSWFGATIIAVVDGNSQFYSINGRGFPNEKQVFDISFGGAYGPVVLTLPYERVRREKKQAGFYFEVNNSRFDGYMIQDPLGHRLGHEAARLEDFQELSYAATGTLFHSNDQSKLSWGLAWCPSPGTYGIILSMNRNNDQSGLSEKFPFSLTIHSWNKEGVPSPPQVVVDAMGWGERKTIPVKIE